MKAYVGVSGGIFALLTLVHIWRMALERTLVGESWFLLITFVSVSLTGWAAVLISRKPATG